MEPTKFLKPQKTTDIFRALKVGQPIEMQFTHYEAPHSFARQVGIKVKTEVIETLKPKGFILKVERVAIRKKK